MDRYVVDITGMHTHNHDVNAARTTKISQDCKDEIVKLYDKGFSSGRAIQRLLERDAERKGHDIDDQR